MRAVIFLLDYKMKNKCPYCYTGQLREIVWQWKQVDFEMIYFKCNKCGMGIFPAEEMKKFTSKMDEVYEEV